LYTIGGCTGFLHSPVKKEHTDSTNTNFIIDNPTLKSYIA
jgi:hypothetical protein